MGLSESGAEEGEVRVARGLADCFATTAGMQHELDDSSFWKVRVPETFISQPCSKRTPEIVTPCELRISSPTFAEVTVNIRPAAPWHLLT